MTEDFTVFQQENILVLLCFSDVAASAIVGTVDLDLFGRRIYRRVAEAAYRFFKEENKAIRDHIYDELETELNSDEGETYKTVLENIYKARESINEKYVIKQISKFISSRNLMADITKAAKLLQEGDLDKAEEV